MADNPNYNYEAWNELSNVQEQLKELHSLMSVIWRDSKEHDDLQTSISALISFTDMIGNQVDRISNMVGPKAIQAA